MLESLRHRGPDGMGRHIAGRFALGMTRLAILDPDNGDQPVYSRNREIVAIVNGEIYNWRELRAELEQAGHCFQTACDSELLPTAWIEWGTSLPEKLNGMFALAIHDVRADTLFLARDRCGQKPLYLTSSGPFLFASEIKALRAGGVSLEPDPGAVATWLSLRYLPEPATFLRGVVTLPAGHWLMLGSDGKREMRRYWCAGSTEKSFSFHGDESRALDELDQLARSSVALALQSDFPMAAYLSGGVDSALLAHYIRDLGEKMMTVSLEFGSARDESAAAAETAKTLELPHDTVKLEPEALEDLPRVVGQMDLPVGDALILAFDALARRTRELGCKVALGGEGPDEHFAGYGFQRAYLTANSLGSFGRWLAGEAMDAMPSRWLDRLSGFPAALGSEGKAAVVDYFKEFSNLDAFARVTGLHRLFSRAEIDAVLHPDLSRQPHDAPWAEPPGDLNTLLATQYGHWLPDWSLIRQDRNAMAHSLEYRAPFLDHRLIDFSFTLPGHLKLRRGSDKYLWRRLAARHLPPGLVTRPKQPFYLPLEDPAWRKPLVRYAGEVLLAGNLSRPDWLKREEVESLLRAKGFLPMKQVAALLILTLWLESLV